MFTWTHDSVEYMYVTYSLGTHTSPEHLYLLVWVEPELPPKNGKLRKLPLKYPTSIMANMAAIAAAISYIVLYIIWNDTIRFLQTNDNSDKHLLLRLLKVFLKIEFTHCQFATTRSCHIVAIPNISVVYSNGFPNIYIGRIHNTNCFAFFR